MNLDNIAARLSEPGDWGIIDNNAMVRLSSQWSVADVACFATTWTGVSGFACFDASYWSIR